MLSTSGLSSLTGYAPAIPTPFKSDGEIDFRALQTFCDYQVREGASALVICGTTGEAPTLSPTEQVTVIQIAVDAAAGRVPVIAGAGSNSTAHAVELTRDAEAAGADAILSVVPYYNRPTQAGLCAHFSAVADTTGLPIILYDVPSRTVTGLADDTIARLAELPRFVGLKDATGDLGRLFRLRSLLGPDFKLLSGDDVTAPAFIAQGGDGCISVTSNVMPALCREMFEACQQGLIHKARQLMQPVARLTTALFLETNPTPVKYALSLLGLMSAAVRLPLVEPTSATKSMVSTALGETCREFPCNLVGNKHSPAVQTMERRRVYAQ
jgi:4-hydroxy-tetrahydrodipicolinate synthase